MTYRIYDDRAREEFERALTAIFPNRRMLHLGEEEISRVWASALESANPKRVIWYTATKLLVFFLFPELENVPIAAVGLEPFQEPSQNDLKFARAYARVFNDDLITAKEVPSQDELWSSLQQTRFSRAIGRFSSFSTNKCMRWLRTIENAATLRYEGQPFAASILMTTQMKMGREWESCNSRTVHHPSSF